MSTEDDNFKEKSAFLFDVIKRYDHYIATTNFKVALMMSFIAAIVLSLTIRIMSITPSGDWFYYISLSSSGLTIILSLVAALNLFKAVFPNTSTHDGKKSLIFFDDVANSDNGTDGYMEKLENATQKSIFEDLSKQTFIMAEIVKEKFRILKIAVNIIINGVIPMLIISLLFLILFSATH